jgi:hypothetical protein
VIVSKIKPVDIRHNIVKLFYSRKTKVKLVLVQIKSNSL